MSMVSATSVNMILGDIKNRTLPTTIAGKIEMIETFVELLGEDWREDVTNLVFPESTTDKYIEEII